MATAPQTENAVEFFKALADPTRFRIVSLLTHGELCVCHLVSGLDLPQSTVSRQLSALRRAGVVQARRQGTWIHYSLARQTSDLVQSQLEHLKRQLSKQSELKADVQRLLCTRGPGHCQP